MSGVCVALRGGIRRLTIECIAALYYALCFTKHYNFKVPELQLLTLRFENRMKSTRVSM